MNNDQYLTFFIRREEYAVSILRVKEIIEYETVTRVPTTPVHVRGVINLRGAVLPVVDLAAKFGHPESEPSRTTCIVVVETQLRGQTIVVGVVADAVSEVVALPATQIEPPPPFGTNVHVDFLVGMGKLDGRLVLVLDIDRILSPVELQETIEAAETAEPMALEAAAQ
ncbi:MAG: CheW protein [Acidobacteria bacterium]|nr:CheW protein [Acidobacteriota bacterium]